MRTIQRRAVLRAFAGLAVACLAAAAAARAGDPAGDPLPAGAKMRLGTTRFRHKDSLTAIAYSPDGSLVVTAAADRTVRVWDAASGKEVSRFAGFTGEDYPECLQFAPGGKTYAVAGRYPSDVLFLVETVTGKPIRQLKAAEGLKGVSALAFSADGTRLAAGSGAAVRLWDTDSGEERPGVKTTNKYVTTILYTRDGAKLFTGGGDGLQCWDTKTGKEAAGFTPGRGEMGRAALSADDRVLAVGSGAEVLLYDTARGTLLGRLAGHNEAVNALAFGPKGDRLYTCARDGSVVVWELRTFREERRFSCGPGRTYRAAFSPDRSTLASGPTNEMAVRFWDLRRGREREEFFAPHGPILSMHFLDGGRLAAACYDDSAVWVWDPRTGKPLEPLPGPSWGAGVVVFAPAHPLLSFERHGRVLLHDYAARKDLHTFTFTNTVHDCLGFSPDGKTVAMAETGGRELTHDVRLYSIPEGKQLVTLPGIEDGVRQLLFSPDGATLAVAGAGGVQLWDVRTRRYLRPPEQQPQIVERVAFSADGRLLVGVPWREAVTVWEVGTGHVVHRSKKGVAAAFTPDGGRLVVGDHAGDLHWSEPGSGEPPVSRRGHDGAVHSLAFAPGGAVLASGGRDTTVLLWDTPPPPGKGRDLTAEELRTLWTELATERGASSRQVVWKLARAGPSADAFLKEMLPALRPRDPAALAALVRQLDATDFEKREAASRELAAYAFEAEEALIRAVQQSRSPELTRRAKELLASVQENPLPAAALRQVRAIQVLEQRGSPGAEEVLRALAGGPPDAPQTRDARAALARLKLRASAGEQK